MTQCDWQSMETAPKDKPILVWNVPEGTHNTCPFCNETDYAENLCLYHAHAEGLGITLAGLQIAVWGGAYDDLPNWWFANDGNMETVLNPVRWMEINDPILES